MKKAVVNQNSSIPLPFAGEVQSTFIHVSRPPTTTPSSSTRNGEAGNDLGFRHPPFYPFASEVTAEILQVSAPHNLNLPKAVKRAYLVWFQEEQEAGDEDEEVIFKIGVAANRYDLLCLEGIAWALRIFIEKEASPLYTVTSVSPESILKMHVKPEALPPQEINFVPLKQSDIKLKKFLHIIENSPVYPVIYDRNR
ncbi:hypothetical protein ZIOFF_076035 [Zingiber officinale]|uniref:Phenylalanine--tRNA ligase beta subunit B1 domain-containing protein n=1 Tax=Zingiber officinale TaxID=94328 RepID=A0A8J5C0E7_ZINOF|nr:hypothetical protein ZIOFF_076035 [Zingiber officinale]